MSIWLVFMAIRKVFIRIKLLEKKRIGDTVLNVATSSLKTTVVPESWHHWLWYEWSLESFRWRSELLSVRSLGRWEFRHRTEFQIDEKCQPIWSISPVFYNFSGTKNTKCKTRKLNIKCWWHLNLFETRVKCYLPIFFVFTLCFTFLL